MKTYEFTVIETHKAYVEVEAESLEEARKMVQQDYDDNQLFLEIDDSAIVAGRHFLHNAVDVVRG